MYKLPQLPHDQLQGFVCALFNQLMFFPKEADFEINGEYIHSNYHQATIVTIPFSIDKPLKEVEKELKERTKKILAKRNLTQRTLIIATNYVVKTSFQTYLEQLNLSYDAIYLDWNAISIFADSPVPTLPLNFTAYYPHLDFHQLPHHFKNDQEKIAYCKEGVYLTSKLLGNKSTQTSFWRIRLAAAYEEQSLFLEALKEHKINASLIGELLNKKMNYAVENFVRRTYSKIGDLYYKLSDYSTGVKWYEDLLTILENYYEDKENDNFLTVIIGVIRGYWETGNIDRARIVFEEIEYTLKARLGDNQGNYIVTSEGNYILSSNNSDIALSIRSVLYTFAARIYRAMDIESKAYVYFEALWNLLNEDKNKKTIEQDTGGLNQQVLQMIFPKYHQKLINQNHIIHPTHTQQSQKNNTPLPFAIKQLQIKKFHAIKDTAIQSIPVDAQWIFITGKNGTGKSSFLQALAAGLAGETIQDYAHLSTQDSTIISIEFLQNNTNQIQTLKVENQQWEFYQENPLDAKKIPILAYGVSRLRIQKEETSNRHYLDNNVFSLFNAEEGNLANIEQWLKNEALKGNENSAQVEMVKTTLARLMPSVSKIEINKKEAQVEYTENGLVVTMEHLASGNKSILAMIGDIMIRLLHFFPSAKETIAFNGIIIIDELDVHLHPSWQRQLPWLLSEIFPRVQFICSTHSIIPFMGAPKSAVFFTINRTEEAGTTIQQLNIDPSNLSANILLSSPLFDVPLLSKIAEEEGQEQEYRTESDYAAYSEKIKKSVEFKELQEKYGDILGDKLFKK